MRGLVALSLSLSLLVACTDGLEDNIPSDTGYVYIDVDGDGMPSEYDCDDNNPLRAPGKAEICDGVDNDCDDEVDEDPVDARIWYVDRDGDHYGNPDEFDISCDDEAPLNRVDNDLDCDDDNATVNPGQDELCDGLDNDCDDKIDESLGANVPKWYQDGDADGFGNSGSEVTACFAPPGYVENADDCNDSNPGINPDEVESCATPFDDDCSGTPNDPDALGCVPFWIDNDQDGYGDDADSTCMCTPAGGFTAPNQDDCDDSDAYTFPGSAELCGDGVDQDCQGGDIPCDVLALGDADVSFGGEQSSDGLGRWIGPGGDLNGDGIDDLLLAAPAPSTGDLKPGTVYAFFGPIGAGAIDPANADSTLTGVANGDWTGHSVAAVGDVNGDGKGDVLIGAPRHDGAAPNAGAAYLVTGPVAGTLPLADARAVLLGEAQDEQAGSVVAAAGDMNGDGRDDLLVASAQYTGLHPEMGAVYLVHGPVSGELSLAEADAKLVGEDYLDHAGAALAGNQDIDGDGIPDLLIGAPNEDSFKNDAGAAYVVLGPVLGEFSLRQADAKITGEARDNHAGNAVAMLGDIDGDGYGDYGIGACEHDGTGELLGAAYVFTSSVVQNGSVADAEAKLVGEVDLAKAGCPLAAAGDVNGDGFDDILVGALGDTAAQGGAGAAFLVYGPVSGTHSLADVAALKILGEADLDRASTGLAGVGDVNDDGLDDIAVGAPENDESGIGAGKAYLIFGF